MDKIRKGDEVVVLTGRNVGKRGVVLSVLKDRNKVVVENINMAKRHTRGNPMQGTPGGIVEKEMPMDISNVAIWNPVTSKPDRIGYKLLEDGRKVRYFKSNKEVVDV
ncbi:MAG: 50S ribosomal protein L24 [Gammaproteobacteria bacterium RIFCSPLOWO2_02_FULL_61_13]|nr:MAG: 50S ribosomal protein L24 [Gammaproteobacteria bacterium RIFCSPLOWO2_02_FULL_61_13]